MATKVICKTSAGNTYSSYFGLRLRGRNEQWVWLLGAETKSGERHLEARNGDGNFREWLLCHAVVCGTNCGEMILPWAHGAASLDDEQASLCI